MTQVEREALRTILTTPGWAVAKTIVLGEYQRAVSRLLAAPSNVGEMRLKDYLVEARCWARMVAVVEREAEYPEGDEVKRRAGS